MMKGFCDDSARPLSFRHLPVVEDFNLTAPHGSSRWLPGDDVAGYLYKRIGAAMRPTGGLR